MLKLYSFFWDCGRMGDIEGLFVEDSDVVEAAIGKEVYLGEALGKHSEVYGTLEVKDLKVLSQDQEKIGWLLEVIGGSTISGYNPVCYLPEYK